MKKLIKFFVPFMFFTGCVHSVHQHHVGDFSPYSSQGKKIEAYAEQFVVLGFVGQTDYVDKAYDDFQRQCKNSEIVGVSTQYWTSLGFFSYTNKILMQGRCLAKG